MPRNGRVALGGALGVLVAVILLMRGALFVTPATPAIENPAMDAVERALPLPAPPGPDRALAPAPTETNEATPEPEPVPEPTVVEPVREYGPETLLNVRSAADRAELLGVTLLAQPDVYWSSGWKVPHGGIRPLVEDAVSPITARAWWYAGDEPDLARGIEMRHAGSTDAVLWDEDSFRISRGMVFFARATGYAWGRANVDLAQGGRHELLCGSACGLNVRLVNAKPAAWARHERDVFLYVSANRDVVTERKLTPDVVREDISLRGLDPGEYALSVEIGGWWEFQSRIVLGKTSVSLVAGAEPTVELVLDDPPDPPARAPVSGTLTFPPFAGETEVVLRLFHADTYSQGEATAELPVGEMNRVAPGARTWAFDAGQLPTGAYQAKVWPLLVSTTFEVPPDGARDVAIEVSALAEVQVTTQDGITGAQAPLEELFWSNVSPLPGQVNHVGLIISFSGEPGRFVFHTAPGAIDLSADPKPPSPHGHTRGEFEVHAGVNAVSLPLNSRCGVRIVLRDGGATLPIGELHQAVTCAGLDDVGRVTMNRLATEGVLELSMPGNYLVRFPSVGPPRYRPVEDREVRVEPGAWQDVIVDLERP